MKKIWWIVCMLGLLTGCSTMETFETLGDISHVSATLPEPTDLVLKMPANAALEVSLEDGGVSMYSCDGYTMVLQMLKAGNLEATIRTLSGFAPENVTILETACGDHMRYDWVWTAVAEEGDLVCRGAVLDDGIYHYALYTIAPSQNAGEVKEDWNELFGSFCLETE